ncbi:MAG: hypothetical protein ACT4PN_08715 [Nitrospiraceae bacterium]
MFTQSQSTQSEKGQDENPRGKKPDLIAYDVRDVEGLKEAVWNSVGAVWIHKDGKGADVLLHAIPLSGRIVLRQRTEKKTS